MFHFLVKGDGWASGRDSMPSSRLFEYTESAIKEKFLPNGNVSREITAFPALFATEISDQDLLARVGTITAARVSGREVLLEYAFDLDIKPILNSTLQKLSADLHIEDFEFARTHWATKDADLFRILLRNQTSLWPSPKVFQLGNEGIDPSLVSVMMPFDAKFHEVYITLQGVAKTLNLKCLRVDDMWKHDAIMQDIVSLISRSAVVVCDCSGRNPNVFYEAGIAHTLGKDVILITQNDEDIPFDLRHLRYIKYLNNSEGRKELVDRTRQRIQTLIEH
jgi:hypothetical protein